MSHTIADRPIRWLRSALGGALVLHALGFAQYPGISAASPQSEITRVPAALVPLAPNDSTQLVARGQQLFKSKRCGRCHTIGQGYKDGPDLAGVTARRSFKQINMLLTDTEEAIQTDPDFQQLRIEHFKDMPNLNLSRADALALYYYLRDASLRAARKGQVQDGEEGVGAKRY